MSQQITLTVVDQSPVREDGSAGEALRESVELAQEAERFGYDRYWVTEHHNTGSVAGAAPEILVGQIAARTNRIRVGSAGVMLTHYSALKVAETFRTLEAFYPGRIDLGIGRAPGSDQLTAAALAHPRTPMDVQLFPQQVRDLLGFLYDQLPAGHPHAQVHVHPGPLPITFPEVWLLGSSDYSARLAASLGLPFAFADFFGYAGSQGPLAAAVYRQQFCPSAYLGGPLANVTVSVTCAETDKEARLVGASRRLQVARTRTGDRRRPLEPPEEALELVLDPEAGPVIAGYTTHIIEGDPATVRRGILEVAERYGTWDIGIATHTYHFEDRVRSYELLAQAFGRPPG